VCKVPVYDLCVKRVHLFISLCTQYLVALKGYPKFIPYVDFKVCKISKRVCAGSSIKSFMLYVKFKFLLELIFQIEENMLKFVVSMFLYDKCVI
jgi:hypothetical protein